MSYYRYTPSKSGNLPDRFSLSIPYTVSCYLSPPQGVITSGSSAAGGFNGNCSGTVQIGDTTYNWTSTGGSLSVNGEYNNNVSKNGTLTITFTKVN